MIALCHTKDSEDTRRVFSALEAYFGSENVVHIWPHNVDDIAGCKAAFSIAYPCIPPAPNAVGAANPMRLACRNAGLKFGVPMFHIDSGPIARDNYFQIGLHGIKNGATFHHQGSPRDKFDRLNLPVKTIMPVKYDEILILGQVRHGIGTQTFDVYDWYNDVIEKLAHQFPSPYIYFIYHYNDKTYSNPLIDKYYPPRSPDIFDEVDYVISYNSHLGIKTLMHGIPTICMDKSSMLAPRFYSEKLYQDNAFFANNDWQWLYDICYTQWSCEEIKGGKFWDFWKEKLPSKA